MYLGKASDKDGGTQSRVTGKRGVGKRSQSDPEARALPGPMTKFCWAPRGVRRAPVSEEVTIEGIS